MGEGRRANDGCVHLAVLVDRGHVIRMDERGVIAEIPLRPTALPDAEGRRTFNQKNIFARVMASMLASKSGAACRSGKFYRDWLKSMHQVVWLYECCRQAGQR